MTMIETMMLLLLLTMTLCMLIRFKMTHASNNNNNNNNDARCHLGRATCWSASGRATSGCAGG